MGKVTYLLGAGASCKCLPIVSDFGDRLLGFRTKICELAKNNNDTDTNFYRGFNNTISAYAKLMEQELNALIFVIGNHQSIDTYAKRLTVQGEISRLNRMKTILTMFFIYEQFTNSPDKRYDSFIAALIDAHTGMFPKNVKVLTWNYDYQFELSLCNFLGLTRFEQAQTRLGIAPHIWMDERLDSFTIHKINGTATILNSKGELTNPFESNFDIGYNEKDLLTEIMIYYATKVESHILYNTGIQYAWETESRQRETIDTAIKNTSDTNVLVVIGYSFPFFNRLIDQKIIKEMKLAAVYIQAPEKSVYNIRQSFKSIGVDTRIPVEPITDTSQFFLPPELSL